MDTTKIALFKGKSVRKTIYQNEWWFSIVDVCDVLTASADSGAYWRKLKQRLNDEGSETVTFCHGLKLTAIDGKMRITDCANTEGIFRIVQSVPSPKAEPFKRWLAKVGYERIQEIEDPELADIQDHVNQKIEQRINRQPYVRGQEMSNYERLTFCDLMDYNNLLQKHWKYFGRFFSSQAELQHHFINVKDYRNALVHSREMNAIEKKQGEASIEWLFEVINHQITVKAIKEADSSDEIAQLGEELEIYCESMDIKANAIYLSNRKVKILKSSSSSLTDSPSFEGNPYQKIKNKLIEQKKLIKTEGKYIFNEDTTLDSVSAAAAVVLGRPASGPREWKISSGVSLKEYFSSDENE